MAAENKSMTDTEIMLGELNRIVSEEMAKKPSVRDEKLIDECIEEMAKLKNVRAGYSKEEIGTIIEEIQAKVSENPKKKPVPRKSVRRTIAAACAACLIMVCGVATVAWNPFHVVCDWLNEITKSSSGTVSKVEDITYINHGNLIKYGDMQELLKNEKLEIYYPNLLPDDVFLTKVEPLTFGSEESINFYFNHSDFKFTIQFNTPLYINIPEYETVKTNNITFYLSYQNDKYVARGTIDSDLYLVECSNYQDILLIINNFTKEK